MGKDKQGSRKRTVKGILFCEEAPRIFAAWMKKRDIGARSNKGNK